MSIFLKAVSGAFISLILWLCLEKRGKDISVLLTMFVCVVILISTFTIFSPVIALIEKLRQMGDINKDYINVILKIVGIGLLSEVASLICKDAGNEAIGKTLQVISTVLILVISVPIIEKLLELLNNILSNV